MPALPLSLPDYGPWISSLKKIQDDADTDTYESVTCLACQQVHLVTQLLVASWEMMANRPPQLATSSESALNKFCPWVNVRLKSVTILLPNHLIDQVEGIQMANLLLFLAIICAGGSVTVYVANEAYTANRATGTVPDWANAVCSAAQMFCHKPEQLAFAAAGLAVLWLLLKFVASVDAR